MERVALKIQRRRFARAAVREIGIHRRLRDHGRRCAELIDLREAFLHDGHICMAFERHGNSLDAALDRARLRPARARCVTRQVLVALEKMHRCGYAHTDVKPGNILYCARSSEARLADLGNGRNHLRQGSLYGTREYTPPEIIIGAPMTHSLDMWALGCTVFEMLTRHLLFSPRKAASEKYREFSHGADAIEMPLAASVLKDDADEEAEQLPRGTIVAGKYRLERVLGRGRFSTVWTAQRLNHISLDNSAEIVRNSRDGEHSTKKNKRQLRERAWRRAKGADDLLDLALNYEHLLLMAKLFGPVPPAMVRAGIYRASYFEEDGEVRFRPEFRPTSLRERLRRGAGLKGDELDLSTDFLRRLLAIDPAQRASAREALAHPWIAHA